MACIKLYVALGARHENFILFDVEGVLHTGRTDLGEDRKPFAIKSDNMTLAQAFKSADVFLGLSVGNIVTKEMILSMPKNPIVFALANPDPEIDYETATQTRKDIIMATGRSDYPNQVNNVLGFPYIFRGALDVRAKTINEAMKLAAVHSLADLAKSAVPDVVNMAYNQKKLMFWSRIYYSQAFGSKTFKHFSTRGSKSSSGFRCGTTNYF